MSAGFRIAKLRWTFVLIGLCIVFNSLSYVRAATCPVLSPAYCSVAGDCNGGTCLRGVCTACPVGKIGEKCQGTDGFLNIGNVLLTQAGLDSAPVNYFKFINDSYTQAKSKALNVSAYDGPCTQASSSGSNPIDQFATYKVQVSAITPDLFTKSDLVQDSIRVVIIQGGVQVSATADFAISKVRLNLWGGAQCCPCTGSCTSFFCPQVCSETNSADWIDFTFSATVTANISLAYNASIQGVSPFISGVAISFNDSSLGAVLTCPTSPFQLISNTVKTYFNANKNQIAATMTPILIETLTTSANKIAQRYQGVQTYVPNPGLILLYKVTNLTINPGTSLLVDLQGKVMTTFFYDAPSHCQINVTYADPAGDIALLPPRVWSPLTKVLSPSEVYSPILAGMRLHRSYFNGMVWATFQNPQNRTRTFEASSSSTGLSALTNLSWSVPYFTIPNDANQNRLNVQIDGQASFSCPPVVTQTVLGFSFSRLNASFNLTFDDTPPTSAIAFQVIPGLFSVQSVSPGIVSIDPVLNNVSLIQSALVGGLDFNAPGVNQFLLEKGNGIEALPPDLQSAFPTAQINIISQGNAGPPAINGQSGYIEMINRCACSSSSQPLLNQQSDGTVQICPVAFLNNYYCQAQSLTSSSSSAYSRRLLLYENRQATSGENIHRTGGIGINNLEVTELGNLDLGTRLSPSVVDVFPSDVTREMLSVSKVNPKFTQEIVARHETNKLLTFIETISDPPRHLSTAQQNSDLLTVLSSLGRQCITKSPTGAPTTRTPTNQPTPRPTQFPTNFEGIDASRDVCVEQNGCYYMRDVFFFVCLEGYAEVESCRYENSDIYCCPISSINAASSSLPSSSTPAHSALNVSILLIAGATLMLLS